MSSTAAQDSDIGLALLVPSPEQEAELLRTIRANIAKRERFEATHAGCSAYYSMTRGSRR